MESLTNEMMIRPTRYLWSISLCVFAAAALSLKISAPTVGIDIAEDIASELRPRLPGTGDSTYLHKPSCIKIILTL